MKTKVELLTGAEENVAKALAAYVGAISLIALNNAIESHEPLDTARADQILAHAKACQGVVEEAYRHLIKVEDLK